LHKKSKSLSSTTFRQKYTKIRITGRKGTRQEAQLMLTTRSTLTRPCRIRDGLTAHTTLTKDIKYSNI